MSRAETSGRHVLYQVFFHTNPIKVIRVRNYNKKNTILNSLGYKFYYSEDQSTVAACQEIHRFKYQFLFICFYSFSTL